MQLYYNFSKLVKKIPPQKKMRTHGLQSKVSSLIIEKKIISFLKIEV